MFEDSEHNVVGESLKCTNRDAFRLASKRAGAIPTREDKDYWFDLYDSTKLLDGTMSLMVGYIKGKFAEAYYEF